MEVNIRAHVGTASRVCNAVAPEELRGVKMTPKEANKLKPKEAQKYLVELMEKLDELDMDDYFGTEGWRRYVMGED